MAILKSTTPPASYPGVQLIRGKDGIVRAYHRKTKTRLTAAIGSPEFLAELAALNDKRRASEKPLRGTLAGLFDAYRGSPEFRGLAPGSDCIEGYNCGTRR